MYMKTTHHKETLYSLIKPYYRSVTLPDARRLRIN